MSAYTVTIAGASYDVLKNSLDVRLPANGLETFSISVAGDADVSPVFRPRQQLIVFEDGAPLVGGIITDTRDLGFGAFNSPSIVTEITACGFSIFLTYAYATITLPAGTLKSMMQAIAAAYLTGYGITVHAGQVDGPILPELTYTRTRLDVIFTELVQRAGFTYAVAPDKTIRAQAVGVVPAPHDLTDTGPIVQTGDVECQSTIDEEYANRIRGLVTGAGPAESTEHFVTDGLAHGGFTDYPVKYPASLDVNGQIWPNGIIGIGPTGWGGPPGFGVYEWTWMPHLSPSRMRHDDAYGITPAGFEFDMRYGIRYPYEVVVNDLADQATFGIRERIVEIPQAMTEEAAREYVQAILDAQHPLVQSIAFKSRLSGWRPGQTLRVTLARRRVDQFMVIRSVKLGVEAGMAPGDDLDLLSSVEAISGTAIRGQFEQVYKDWLGKSAVVSGQVAPAVPPVFDLRYFGDYKPATYNDGDIVVAADGIAYLCVQNGVVAPPAAWPAGSPALAAHGATHNAGGTDPITAIDAGIIVSGVLSDARLSVNVARRDQKNVFIRDQWISGSAPHLVLNDESQAADARAFRLINSAGALYIQSINDAITDAPGSASMARNGDFTFGRNVLAGNAFYEAARGAPVGYWINEPFAAANFFGVIGMVWTVASADVRVNHYTLIGKTLTWSVSVGGSLSGTINQYLLMRLPGGLRARVGGDGGFVAFVTGAAGLALAVGQSWPSDPAVLLLTSAAGTNAAGALGVQVTFVVEVA